MTMKTLILFHDIQNAKATIKFTYGDISYTSDYDIDCLVPGTAKVFADLGLPFDQAAQLKAIEYLKKNVESAMEGGQITTSMNVSQRMPDKKAPGVGE